MTYEELQETARQNMRRIKAEKELSIARLAGMTGISAVTISMVLSGKRNISMYTLWVMAEALGVEPKELLDGKSICGKHRKALQGHAVGHRKDKA